VGSMFEIYLIRHGQTDWNTEGRLQGHTDIHLNDQGIEQALKLKEKLALINFSAVVSSDLARAHKTAELVLEPRQLGIITTPELRERSLGRWEGFLWSEYNQWLKEKVSLESLTKDEYVAFKAEKNIESYDEVYTRVKNCITSNAASLKGSTVLFASHGGVLAAVLYNLDFRPGHRWLVNNCGYIKLRVDARGEFSLIESDGVQLIKGW